MLFNAVVARPVGKAEIEREQKAKDAMQKEWDRLKKIKTWGDTIVKPWSEVAREARKTLTNVHVGSVFSLIVEKNYENLYLFCEKLKTFRAFV